MNNLKNKFVHRYLKFGGFEQLSDALDKLAREEKTRPPKR